MYDRAQTGGRMKDVSAGGSGDSKVGARVLGPALFLLLVLVPTPGLAGGAKLVAAAVLWMAVWWVTEAVPLAVTSLLPLVVFPVTGVQSVRDVAPNYGKDMVFLFLGGFVLALAVERSGLHRRIALRALAVAGEAPRRQVWGFLTVTAALSMWLSNTATTLMMLPIAAGVAARFEQARHRTRLMLAVAYGASIGGLGTLVGTPPNVVLAGMAPDLVPGLPSLGFGQWMLFGLPLVVLLIPVAGVLLGRGLKGGRGECSEAIRDELAGLGRMRPAEVRAAVLFLVTAVAWITRAGFSFGSVQVPGWASLLPDPHAVRDAVPAIAAAVLASLIPKGNGERAPLVTWDDIRHGVPWGVLLLFGGGFALADAVHASGLDGWLAGELHGLAGLPLPVMVLAVCLVAMGATELTSNTATATLLMPVMAALATALGEPPYLLMVPATVACSCAFMLPVATPPNAIVIGSGFVGARDLFVEGIRLNLVSALLITILVLTLGRLVLPLG